MALAVAAFTVAGVAQAQKGSPPTVTLSASPTTFATGASTVLTANAADPGGAVVRVNFYDGATQIAQLMAAPFQYTYTPSTPGTHIITAVAIDNTLLQATSNAVTLTVGAGGNTPPIVSITASSTSIGLGAATFLQATASDPDGSISKVAFYSNGVALATLISPPYEYNYIPGAAGNYNLTAVATDNSNASTTSSTIALTVQAGAGGGGKGNSPPTVSLAASTTNVAIGNSSTLTATAADADGIAKVEFYNGSALAATDTTAPYSYTFSPAAAGTFTLYARAYDTKGAYANSNSITITATGTAAAVLPRITLGLTNTLVAPGGTINLTGTAAATAPATVTRVSFYMNGVKLVDDTTSPYGTTATLTNPGTYTFYATVTDSLGQIATTLNQIAVAQTAAPVVTTDPDIVRLLNQATFGFSQAEAARVNALGIAGWINDQLTQPVSGYPDSKYNRIQLNSTVDCTTQMPNGQGYPGDSPQAICARDHLTLAMVQRDFFTNAIYAPDQLRQRVAWALSQIVVTSANEPDLSYAHVMSRYQSIMFQEAFGNYETLLRKVTYNPAMGNYLDAVNNDRAPAPPTTSTRVPNENYAREIMQLFSINLIELNQDGTPLLDANGNTIATYGQTEIAEFAKVFTGYTYANSLTQVTATGKQGRYYGANMVPYPTTSTTGHDPNAKNLLNGTVLPAGQTGQQDMDAAVRNVFMHPNTPVYVGRQLIQRLVTGNPSPAYLSRVVGVFINNGAGVRGDMAAVVKAILLDPEARGPAKTASDFGSLREPVLMVTAMLRALNGVTDGNRLEGATSNLGQRPYYAPTVFNYFMPDAKVPGTSILGPEFGIHTTVTAVGRANLVYQFVYGNGYNPDTTIPNASGSRVFLGPFEAIADNPAAMVSLVNQHLAGGQFPAALEPTIVAAVSAVSISAVPTAAERTARARMAVYLMASSYDYQVQR